MLESNGDGFALTAPQMAIWADQALHPGKPIYNTGQILTIRGMLDRGRFATALRQVVTESDALRLRFVQQGASVLQYIVDGVDPVLTYRDFSSTEAPETSALSWMEETFWAPLGPDDFPLFRFALAKVAPAHYFWLQKYHHLVIDATGRRLVAARTAAIYNE